MVQGQTHVTWGEPLFYLRRSIYAQQVLLALYDEQSDNVSSRTHGSLVETTVQRNVALGDLIRLHFSSGQRGEDQERTLVRLVVALYRAKEADRANWNELLRGLQGHPDAEKMSRALLFWHKERVKWLSACATSLRHIVPSHTWTMGRNMAQEK